MPNRRARFGLDSNCLIALLCDWHTHHRRTLAAYEYWLAKSAQPVIAANSILECFAVLTRLPSPYRLPPETVRRAISETFLSTAVIVGISPETAVSAVDNLCRLGLGGGQVYDAVIAHSIAEAGAVILLTWNLKHFLTIAPAGLEVREP